jgi:hypothetical protein
MKNPDDLFVEVDLDTDGSSPKEEPVTCYSYA